MSELADDVRGGLGAPPYELPAKHLYDEEGARLFDRICELPEYYPTRAERAILEARAGEIAQRTRATELVELGSGNPRKTRLLLDALRAAGTLERYVPFDVAEEMLRTTGDALAAALPGLRVEGVVGDFERDLPALPPPRGRRLVAFLGSTIGNLLPGPRRAFLRAVRGTLGPGDRLLLGADLVKDPGRIVAAYDDAAGLTAAFYRNLLLRLNRELGADLDPGAWAHLARWNPEEEWMELGLRARRAQTVTFPTLPLTVRFAAGDELRTEISAKFTRERLEADLAAAGLRLDTFLRDGEGLFSLSLATPA